jgi:hypothetical protein
MNTKQIKEAFKELVPNNKYSARGLTDHEVAELRARRRQGLSRQDVDAVLAETAAKIAANR